MIDKRWCNSIFEHEVKVFEKHNSTLENTYSALDWLRGEHYRDSVDYDIDMHGGLIEYTSFYFDNIQVAIEFALANKCE